MKNTSPSLTIKETELVLNTLIKNKIHIPLLLWGKPGIGKSDIVKKVAKNNGYELIDIRLSQKESVDIIGMPITSTININGEDHNVLDFHPPSWFVKALFEGNCVLFFDEINRGRREVLQAIFQIIYDRTLNGNKLPDTVYMCAACNPPSEGEDVIELGNALNDRFLHIFAEPSVKDWIEWAKENEIDPDIIEYARTTQDFFGKPSEFTLRDLNLESGGRTAERASVVKGLDLPDSIKMVLYMGLFGPEQGMEFYKSMKESEEKVISLEEIEKYDEKTSSKIQEYTSGDEPRVDILKRTCLKIEDNPEKWLDYYPNIIRFLREIPLNLSSGTLKVLINQIEFKEEFLPFVKDLAKEKFVEEIKKLSLGYEA